MHVEVAFSESSSPTLVNVLSPTLSEGGSFDTRRADFWFNDGNVILLAGNVAFKVHRGNLERHSDVFHDLLTLPQPPDITTFEDCNIIELHDSPSDLWYLLKALYDGL